MAHLARTKAANAHAAAVIDNHAQCILDLIKRMDALEAAQQESWWSKAKRTLHALPGGGIVAPQRAGDEPV